MYDAKKSSQCSCGEVSCFVKKSTAKELICYLADSEGHITEDKTKKIWYKTCVLRLFGIAVV
jgi:hypothetical protein